MRVSNGSRRLHACGGVDRMVWVSAGIKPAATTGGLAASSRRLHACGGENRNAWVSAGYQPGMISPLREKEYVTAFMKRCTKVT